MKYNSFKIETVSFEAVFCLYSAHNAGEDTIIAIDIVISVITLVKGITKAAQKLPKFTKWIDEVLERRGNGAKKVLSKIIYSEEDLLKFITKNGIRVADNDLKTVLKITGGRADLCESILLSIKEITEGKNINQLVAILKIKNVPKPNSLSNYQARVWYTWKKTGIEKEIQNITDLEKKS